MNYDPEELVQYILEHFEILPDNQTTGLSRMNKISSDEYDDLYEKLHHLFVDKFDFVNYKNMNYTHTKDVTVSCSAANSLQNSLKEIL